MPQNSLGMPCYDDALHTPIRCPFCGEPLKIEVFKDEEVPTVHEKTFISAHLLLCANPKCRKLLGLAESIQSER